MKIGVSGSREGITMEAKIWLDDFMRKNNLSITEAHHGDCVGADFVFHEVCSQHNHIKLFIHPPNRGSMRAYCKGNTVLPEKPYLERNRDIVDAIDLLLAFPSTQTEVLRSGTWSTIRCARKLGKRLITIFPDGSTKEENSSGLDSSIN